MTADADRILSDWRAWHARTLRAVFLADGYLPGDWGAANESYEAAWLAALAPGERWALRVGEAYDTLAGVLADRAVARELARHPGLVRRAARLQSQFDRQTLPDGISTAMFHNEALETYRNRARTHAKQALETSIRNSASIVTWGIGCGLR